MVMRLRFVRRMLAAGIVSGCIAGSALGQTPKLAAAGPSTKSAGRQITSIDEFYIKMIEPSLADGRITAEERENIRSIGAKSLSKTQMAELEKMLDAIAADTARAASRSHIGTRLVSGESKHDAAGVPMSDVECCESDVPTSWYDNLSITTTIEAFKGPIDLGQNGNFGGRVALNWGHPVWEEYGLGVQLGTAATLADFHGTQFTDENERFQSHSTIGVFQRHNRFNWGAVYDFLWDDYYLHMNLRQGRLQASYDVSCSDEVGVWAAVGDNGDRSLVLHDDPAGGPPIPVQQHQDAITQGNLFWRHIWCNDIVTRGWIGMADQHGDWIIGADAHVPLTRYSALVGGFHYIAPSNDKFPDGVTDEIWSVSVGLAIYPGHSAHHATQSRYAPLMPVANNGSMAVQNTSE